MQPAFSSNLELSHSYKNLLISSLSFSHTKDNFGQLTVHDLNNESQLFIRRNYYNSNQLTWSEDINYDIFPWWKSHAQLIVYYAKTHAYSEYLNPNYSGWGGYFSTVNEFYLNKSKTFMAELSYDHHYASSSGEMVIGEYYSLGIGLKLLLLEKQLQISLNANDIFKSDLAPLSRISQDISQTFKQYYDSQYVRLNLSYKFGNKNLSARKKQTSNEEEVNRAQ